MTPRGMNVALDPERLRYYRRSVRMTQAQLADAAGVGESSILRLESKPKEGDAQGLRLRTAERLASALGIEVDDLMLPEKVPA
jgi:transcriptional regulator with XRE-family HTH domain